MERCVGAWRLFSVSAVLSVVILMSATVSFAGPQYSMTCSSCHGMPPFDSVSRDPNTGGFQGNHQTHQPPNATAARCDSCHVNAASFPTAHRDGKISLRTSINGSPLGVYKVNSQTVAFKNQTSVPVLGTCSNVNCHFESDSPLWGSATFTYPADCGRCHGNPPAGTAQDPGAAGSHAKHDSYYPAEANCVKCHVSHTTFAHASSAGKRNLIVSLKDPLNQPGGSYSGPLNDYLPSQTNVFGTCTNTYCHSNGQSDNARAPKYRTVTWGSGVLNCGSCHNNMKTFANATSGSHVIHAQASGANYDCAVCHNGYTATTVTTVTHVNKKINLGFTGNGAGTVYTKYSAAGFAPGKGVYGTCGTSRCHGGAQVKIVWGADTTRPACFKCHGSTATTGFTTVTSASVAPGGGTSGRDLAGNTADTSPRVGTHQSHLTAATGISAKVLCNACHLQVNSFGDAAHLNYTTATVTFSGLAVAQTHSPSVTRASGVITCNNTYCHTGKSNTGSAMAPAFNATTYLSTSLDMASCKKCHNMPPANTDHTGIANLTAFPATSCRCHNNLSSTGTTYANIFLDKTMHLNGMVEGGTCVGCHSSQQGTGTRRVVGTDTTLASHHIQAGTIDSATCSVCHEQVTFGHKTSGNDVAVGLFNQDTGAALTYDGTTATANNLEIACASCHDANGASRLGVNALKPFTASGDNSAPLDVKWTAGTQAHSNTGAGTQPGCFKCHGKSGAANTTLDPKFNGHGSPTAKLLQFGYTAGSEQTFCYTCHGTTPANGAVNAIQPLFAKTRKHSTQSCDNCHNKHQAKPGTHTVRSNTAAGVLNGAAGAKLNTNPAFWAAPAAGNFAAVTIASGTDVEATLCFKCHTIYTAGYNATSPSGSYAMTDIAREFNPGNTGNYATTGTTSWAANETAGGFHPVLATAGSNLGAVRLTNLVTTNIAWSTSARNLMTCSDCHGSNLSTDPLGPHGSANNYILRGPNTLWNSTMVATSTGMPANTFCANCHSSTYAGSRMGTQHTSRSDHRVNCWNCHAAIPHGGPRPGMLISPAGAVAGVGGTIAGWDTTSPYWRLGTSTRKLYIKSYPTNNTTNWGQSNCGCNGTNH